MNDSQVETRVSVRHTLDRSALDDGPTAGLRGQHLAVQTLWWREVVLFVRQRNRVTSAFAQPLVFWLLLGGGLNASFRPPGGNNGPSYMTYFYPGVIALVLLFTAIFATIAVVEDRQAGFLQGVLVAPVSRGAIVAGQALGCTTLALLEGTLFLLLAPFAGIKLSVLAVGVVLVMQFLVAFGLTNLGLIIAWRMDSTQGFHAIMNLILLPIWLLSGALFPSAGTSPVLRWIMTFNPLTYGVAALRWALYLGEPSAIAPGPPIGLSIVIMLAFCIGTFWAAMMTAERVRQ